MTIRAGDVMPKGSLGIMTATGPGQISTDDLFTGKRVVLFRSGSLYADLFAAASAWVCRASRRSETPGRGHDRLYCCK